MEANKEVRLKNSNGSIEYEIRKIAGKDVTIDNQFGKITLRLPREQTGRFNASTDFGSIRTNFKLNVEKDINRQSIDEAIGNEDVKFTVRNRNGQIDILSN